MGKKKKEEMYVCAFVILLESLKESLENNFPRPKKKKENHTCTIREDKKVKLRCTRMLMLSVNFTSSSVINTRIVPAT